MNISFAKENNWQEHLFYAYTFRFKDTPLFTQLEDCITTAVNPTHREGYDNVSLLSKQVHSLGVTVTTHCSFNGYGCPEIILVEVPEQCPDGAVRYGACYEIIPWKNGINVWRHYRDADGRCHWHLRLGLTFPVEEDKLHEMTVQVLDKQLHITLDGMKTVLRTEDLPENFHVGITGCEGIARFYDMQILPAEGPVQRLQDREPSI